MRIICYSGIAVVLLIVGMVGISVYSFRLPSVFSELSTKDELKKTENKLKGSGFEKILVEERESAHVTWKKKSVIGFFYVEIHPYENPDLGGVGSMAVGYTHPFLSSMNRKRYINK